MTQPAVAFREYVSADEEGVLALLRAALGDGRPFDRSSAFWNWKHFENPFGPSLLLIAEGGDIVGLRAFMRWEFRHAGGALKAVRAVDTATHPTIRRHGIFSTLTRLTIERARDEAVDLIFNTPNRYSLPGYLKMGWTYVGRPQLLVKILRPARTARTLLARAAVGDVAPVSPHSSSVPVAQLLDRIEPLERLLGANDRLLEGSIRTARSLAFLRWRYREAPSLAYFACWDGENPMGAAVIYRLNRRQHLREGMACEVLLSSPGVRSLAPVIRRVVTSVDADYLVAHAHRGSPHWWALVRVGFVPLPSRLGPVFTVRPLSDRANRSGLGRLERWRLSLSDLEVF